MEDGVRVIRNEKGEIISRTHGELNVDLLAKFLIKNIKATS